MEDQHTINYLRTLNTSYLAACENLIDTNNRLRAENHDLCELLAIRNAELGAARLSTDLVSDSYAELVLQLEREVRLLETRVAVLQLIPPPQLPSLTDIWIEVEKVGRGKRAREVDMLERQNKRFAEWKK